MGKYYVIRHSVGNVLPGTARGNAPEYGCRKTPLLWDGCEIRPEPGYGPLEKDNSGKG